jgi:hypothetical protein
LYSRRPVDVGRLPLRMPEFLITYCIKFIILPEQCCCNWLTLT